MKKNVVINRCFELLRDQEFLIPEDVKGLQSYEIFITIISEIEKEMENLENKNPTCKFWVQYCRMIFLVKDFIYTEKSGNWDLHIKTVERMLPFFHETDHFAYAKSIQVYIDDASNLHKLMNEADYKKFTELGFWTVRTDKFFRGIFTDQTEQTLMRLLKFEGGLFRRGVTESVAFQWIMAFIYAKDIIEGLENFTNCSFDKNYQHKDSTDARINEDTKALKLIEDFFGLPFPIQLKLLLTLQMA